MTATVQDSISCAVTYRWTAPSGTLAQPAERSTLWTAPQQEGSVPVTVTVTCPTDNKTASDTVNIQVTRPPVRNYTFEDVLLRLRPLLAAAGSDARARRSGRGDARERDAADRDRRPHLQHRHGRIQPGARRPPRERGAGLPRQPRRHRRPAADGQLRRRAAEVRQQPRRNAPPEPARGARRSTCGNARRAWGLGSEGSAAGLSPEPPAPSPSHLSHALHPPLPRRLLRPRPRRGHGAVEGRRARARQRHVGRDRHDHRRRPRASCSPVIVRQARRSRANRVARQHCRRALARHYAFSSMARLWFVVHDRSRSPSVVVLACGSPRCKEGGTIKVHSLSFKGVKAVDESRLKDALATRQSSKIPWGKKYLLRPFALRRRPEAHRRRSTPTAAFPMRASPASTSSSTTSRTRSISPSPSPKASRWWSTAIDFAGFDVIPPEHLDDLKKRVPLKVGQPRDRQLVVSTHELAVNELKDHGFPYGKVATERRRRRDGKQARLTFTAEPGKLAHFGAGRNRRQQERRRAHHPAPADLQAGRPLSAQRRAGLAAAALRHGAVPVRQRRAAEPGAAAGRSAGRA